MTTRDSQRPYISSLRAAQKNQTRPTAMILHDHFALHRKWWDQDWKPSLGDDAWTDWDYCLADAFQVIEDYTDNSTGQFLPFDQSSEVWWDTKSMFSGSAAAIEKEKEKRKEGLKPGETLYAVPVFADPDHKPTLASWLAETERGEADGRPPEAKGARPPTAEELAAMG